MVDTYNYCRVNSVAVHEVDTLGSLGSSWLSWRVTMGFEKATVQSEATVLSLVRIILKIVGLCGE